MLLKPRSQESNKYDIYHYFFNIMTTHSIFNNKNNTKYLLNKELITIF